MSMTYLTGNAGQNDDLVLDGGDVGVLIAHSIGGTPEECAHLVEALARHGHSVSCPLLLGHGGSQILLGATGPNHWLASLEAAHQRLSRRCSKIVVLGYLTGAILALRFAQIQATSPMGIILCAPSVWPPGWQGSPLTRLITTTPFKWAANWFRLTEYPPFGIADDALRLEALSLAEYDAAWHDGAYHRTAGAALELRRLAQVVQRNITRVSAPTLILLPGQDHAQSEQLTERLQAALTVRVEVLKLDETLYRVLEDQQRSFAAERIAEFIAYVERARDEQLLDRSQSPDFPDDTDPQGAA